FRGAKGDFSMRHLPSLVSGACRCMLPLCEHSASVLASFLLTERSAQSSLMAAELLGEDPVLLLWSVCAADCREGYVPHTVQEMADWFVRHILDVLQWPDRELQEPDSTTSDIWGQRAARVFQAADRTSLFAAEQNAADVEHVRLRALLCEASAWLSECSRPLTDGPCCLLPEWLKEVDDSAAALIKKAREFAGGSSTTADQSRLEAIRHRWLESDERFRAILPRLTAIVARLATLEKQFQESLEREKLLSLAEFAAGAGHEINNPLTVIAGRAQLFLQQESDPERRRALALMNSQAMRVYEMIADMMLFARPPQPNFALVDVSKIIDEIVRDLQVVAARQQTSISRIGSTDPLEIEADATQLAMAFRAICQNSLEALGQEGEIEIELQAEQREASVRFADNGPGILPEERRLIFDPFYSARQAGRGLGLGLSKCWRIVDNHGGRFEVRSIPGKSTEFIITLPRQQ
ncbi:MAG: sensor histidine kinase, partial [Thermoguttaceae bacterium]